MTKFSYTIAEKAPLIRQMTNALTQLKSVARNRAGLKREGAQHILRDFDEIRGAVERYYGSPIQGKKILELGAACPETRSLQFAACGNDCSVIDTDVFVNSWFDWRGWQSIVRSNGWQRLPRVMARRAFGLDQLKLRLLTQAMQLKHPPALHRHVMDAANLSFGDSSFDLVFSIFVFEHVAKPEETLLEIKRVLKPGGVAFHRIDTFDAFNGGHDLRLNNSTADAPSPWAQLIPSLESSIQPCAYVNRLTIPDWVKLVEKTWPGAQFHRNVLTDKDKLAKFKALRAAGFLSEYSEADLLTAGFDVYWTKPKAGKFS